MKRLALLLFIISTPCLAEYTIRTTKYIPPEPEKVKQAQDLLTAAIKVQEDQDTYLEKLRQAAQLIKINEVVEKTYIDLYIKVGGEDISGQSWEIVPALYEGQEHVCFEGTAEDLVLLINHNIFSFEENGGVYEAEVIGKNVHADLRTLDEDKQVVIIPCTSSQHAEGLYYVEGPRRGHLVHRGTYIGYNQLCFAGDAKDAEKTLWSYIGNHPEKDKPFINYNEGRDYLAYGYVNTKCTDEGTPTSECRSIHIANRCK